MPPPPGPQLGFQSTYPQPPQPIPDWRRVHPNRAHRYAVFAWWDGTRLNGSGFLARSQQLGANSFFLSKSSPRTHLQPGGESGTLPFVRFNVKKKPVVSDGPFGALTTPMSMPSGG
jgi:hypothetical protein